MRLMIGTKENRKREKKKKNCVVEIIKIELMNPFNIKMKFLF